MTNKSLENWVKGFWDFLNRPIQYIKQINKWSDWEGCQIIDDCPILKLRKFFKLAWNRPDSPVIGHLELHIQYFKTHFVTNCTWFTLYNWKSLHFHNDILNFNSKLLSSFMQIKCWWSRIMAFLYVFLQSTGKIFNFCKIWGTVFPHISYSFAINYLIKLSVIVIVW